MTDIIPEVPPENSIYCCDGHLEIPVLPDHAAWNQAAAGRSVQSMGKHKEDAAMTDIVSVPTGNFTPGARATLEFPAALINAAWNQANAKFELFEYKMGLVTNTGGRGGWMMPQFL